jgi:hypothetical protein
LIGYTETWAEGFSDTSSVLTLSAYAYQEALPLVLAVFGGANWTTSGEPDVERMVFAGAYYKGPFAQRPNDSLGFAVSLVDVNPRLTERINSILSKTTGAGPQRRRCRRQSTGRVTGPSVGSCSC